jgi:hypothetical protein
MMRMTGRVNINGILVVDGSLDFKSLVTIVHISNAVTIYTVDCLIII